jgi:hypothetical protein
MTDENSRWMFCSYHDPYWLIASSSDSIRCHYSIIKNLMSFQSFCFVDFVCGYSYYYK